MHAHLCKVSVHEGKRCSPHCTRLVDVLHEKVAHGCDMQDNAVRLDGSAVAMLPYRWNTSLQCVAGLLSYVIWDGGSGPRALYEDDGSGLASSVHDCIAAYDITVL